MSEIILNESISEGANQKKWYVLRAIGGKEKKVKQYIESEIARLNIQDYIHQVLIPTEKVYQVSKGKKISKERTFFPGYVLVEAILVGEIAHILKSVPNVISFLSETKGGEPVPLRQNEVNRILGHVDELAANDEALTNPYYIGENVKVTDGPFSGFSGVIEEINEEKRKLKVMVKIFGRKTPLELSFIQVEKE
jgi:transcriptional antiterminator NusG